MQRTHKPTVGSFESKGKEVVTKINQYQEKKFKTKLITNWLYVNHYILTRVIALTWCKRIYFFLKTLALKQN